MHLLRLSGVRAIDYWLARFLFDLPQYIILLALLLFLILQPWTPVCLPLSGCFACFIHIL